MAPFARPECGRIEQGISFATEQSVRGRDTIMERKTDDAPTGLWMAAAVLVIVGCLARPIVRYATGHGDWLPMIVLVSAGIGLAAVACAFACFSRRRD
jgi:hypothetical protein